MYMGFVGMWNITRMYRNMYIENVLGKCWTTLQSDQS